MSLHFGFNGVINLMLTGEIKSQVDRIWNCMEIRQELPVKSLLNAREGMQRSQS